MDDMADEDKAGTFTYTIGSREFVFKTIERGQLIMLQRYVETLQAKASKLVELEDLDGVIAIGKKISKATWTTIESQFTSDDDLEWVQLEIIAGRVDERDLLPLLSNGQKVDVPDDDAEPVAIKRAGRKAPAKKPAKKATTSRAKR